MHRWFLPFLFLSIGSVAEGQDIAADLQALNDHFNGQATFELDRDDRLTAEYLKGGEAYRIDYVYVEFLAPATFSHNSEENTLMLQCVAERPQCIDKEVTKSGAISHTGRMNLPMPTADPKGAHAVELFTKLVNDVLAEHQAEDQGTKRKVKRKN